MINTLAHPVSRTTTLPGADNPRAMIVVTWTTWGEMWSWEVQYALDSDRWYMQHFATDFCEMDHVVMQETDLRDEI
jgi:hypothetical protein